jgi:uncharacterized protein YkwD
MSQIDLCNFASTIFKLSLICGLIDIAISPQIIAQNNVETVETKAEASLEQAVIAEINRARTDPIGYTAWLESQKQYYKGIVLELPGEKPVRINKGLQALEEAIAFLQKQEPLPPLNTSASLTTIAQEQVSAIAQRQTGDTYNIDNITYGRVTPQGIVMELIVDSRFPDRRHRTSLFNPQHNVTGIVCQNDPQYDNICAIAYQGDDSAIARNNPSTENTEPPSVIIEANSATTSESTTNPTEIEIKPEETQTSVDTPPTTTNPTEIEIKPEASQPPVTTPPTATTPETIEVPQPETETETNANVPDNSELLGKIERGTLDTGDKTIPDDGSFYDSYPLEGKAGDSFIITLESDEFDTFLAIMDAKGTIIEQNDDIDDKNSNSLVRVTLPDDGVYSLIVNAYNEGGKGKYVLTVRN